MEHIARSFRVSLCITHPDLDPAEITGTMGLLPQRTTRAGALRSTPTGTPLEGRYNFTCWMHEVHVQGASELGTILQDVVKGLGQQQRFFDRVVKDGGTVELFCGVRAAGNWDEVISHALMKQLASLHIDLRLDVYPEENSSVANQGRIAVERSGATRRAIQGVLDNFLGTFTSRYSDYDGYWLFGLIVEQITAPVEIELLHNLKDSGDGPMDAAIRLAKAKFAEQMQKARLAATYVKEARLKIERLPGSKGGAVNFRPAAGFDLVFSTSAVADTGRVFVSKRTLFVAPHNPEIELRSTRRLDQNSA